jgi:hypothetical protein
MRTRCTISALVAVMVLGFVSSAYAWGYATHAYIAYLLNKKVNQKDLNEVYAAMAPDLFNLRFDLPVMGDDGLYFWMHYRFDLVLDQKETGQSKGLGYGFASHNDAWGADYTAHHSGRTYGQAEGYVIAKAVDLGEADPTLSYLVGPEVALDLQHNLVEYALDLLTKRLDPEIGERIVASAMCRSPEFPALLVAAYADEEQFAALVHPADPAEVIVGAEADFNAMMVSYGQILMLDEEAARVAMSYYLAMVAEDYLAANGIELPVPSSQLPYVVNYYLDLAMAICEVDYPAEIAATIDYVDEEMRSRKIGNQG